MYAGSASGPAHAATLELERVYDEADGGYGWVLADQGDLNGDGISDIGVSDYWYRHCGAVDLYYGAPGGPASTPDQQIVGDDDRGFFGDGLGGGGDINGDGYDDVVVGASHARDDFGAVYVFFGGASGPAATADSIVQGPAPGANFGFVVSDRGDLDADGYDDVAVTERTFEEAYEYVYRGAVDVYYGSPTGLAATADLHFEGASPTADMGWSLAIVPDLTGDGADDLMIGSPGHFDGAGRVDIYSNLTRDMDGDGWAGTADCDDDDPSIHPGASGSCDGVDRDCSGAVGDHATDGTSWYLDADGDGYGTRTEAVRSCDTPDGYVPLLGDCDDARADVHPGGSEVCDRTATDDDCDGRVNDADPDATGQTTRHPDTDGDGFGDPALDRAACARPAGYVHDGADCNDARADVSPRAAEVCDGDGLDEDCNGLVNDADSGVIGLVSWHDDADGDGFGDPALTVDACEAPAGYTRSGTDCDDAAPTVHPGAAETCDAVDNNCNDLVDDADPTATNAIPWWTDADGDG